MKKLYSNQDLGFIEHLKCLVENHGIPCVVKNEFLQTGGGILPAQEIWPELWVLDNASYPAASEIISKALADDLGAGNTWNCPSCREKIEAQFTECWKCGSSKEI